MSPATQQCTTSPATDLERRLIGLLSDAKDAARALDHLDSDLGFDVGCELHAARKSLQRAYDILDAAAQPTDRHDADPRSFAEGGRVIVSY